MDVLTIQYKTRDFTVINNEPFRDAGLSLKAKGMLVFLLTLPKDWTFTVSGIATQIKEGTDTIYAIIDELRTAGYCHRVAQRDKAGRICGWNYTFSEYKVADWCTSKPLREKPHQEKPDVAQPDVAQPHVENPETYKNTDSTKKQIILKTPVVPKTFTPPTLDEVREYAKSRGNVIDPEEFYDKCTAVGWMDKNHNKYKDWKAAYRTWERYRKNNTTSSTNDSSADPTYATGSRRNSDF